MLPKDAINKVRETNPKSVETTEQERFVYDFFNRVHPKEPRQEYKQEENKSALNITLKKN